MHTLEQSHLYYRGLEDGQSMPLDLRLDQCAHFPLTAPVAHTHPTPPINRIFLFTGGGSCDVTFEGQTHRLGSDRFWLIPLLHTLHVRYASRGHFHFVHFTAKSAAGMDLFRRVPKIAALPPDPALQRRFCAAFTGHTPVAALQFQGVVTELVTRFADRPEILALWREDSLHTPYRAVLDHIRTHNRHGLRIADLARLAGMSPDALRKGFRRSMGMSLKAYLMSDLLHKALNLLLGTDLNITEIADRLGYETPFYFERVFKRAMREPPLRYRKDSHDWLCALRQAR